MRKGGLLKNPVIFLFLIISICCMFVVFVSVLRLPDARSRTSAIVSLRPKKIKTVSKTVKIGKFGEMIIEMLPKDLGFTVFLPSERAFERDLRLQLNDSLIAEQKDDTYAILTRVLGFSAIPRMIYSDDIFDSKEVNYDSLSGYILFISKDLDGRLMVNGVISEQVDLKKGKIVVHIMGGVIMDAEFEQSFRPEDLEDD